jgi:hypothetical protein
MYKHDACLSGVALKSLNCRYLSCPSKIAFHAALRARAEPSLDKGERQAPCSAKKRPAPAWLWGSQMWK